MWITVARKEFIGPRDLGGLLELARAEGDSPIRSNDGEKQLGDAIVQ